MATTVYFATNRVLTGDAAAVASYGADIQPPSSPNGIIYGTAFVDGSDLDDNAQWTISRIAETRTGQFPASAIDDLSAPGRNLLIFVHGFDNNFSDAITRAAFNRAWMSASGVPAADTTAIAFSWPSKGQIFSFPVLDGDYLHDQQMARNSALHIMTFFAALEPIIAAARSHGQKCILLAHSMGNLALESAVENWFLHGNGDARLFDVAVLAAGDCGYASFTQPNDGRLSGLRRLAQRISIYYSHRDAVLTLSEVVNEGAQRLGQDGPKSRTDQGLFPPTTYRMVDATGFTDFEVTPLASHQYYCRSQAARRQIVADIEGGASPS